MKKINNLAWMSAIALAGAMGFTACSSDDDTMENVNPSYNGESVKTQFAINIPAANKTRMADATVQETGTNFRGMQNVVLFSSVGDPADDGVSLKPVTLESTNISALEGTDGQYRKVYSNVEIPVGTDHFLFYGQATKGSLTDAENGVLTVDTDDATSVSDITAQLTQINSETLSDDVLLGILNGILAVEYNNTAWSATEQVALKAAYSNFITLKAGSANSILKAVERLYNNLQTIKDVNGNANLHAAAIIAKIEESFTATAGTAVAGSVNYTLAYNTPSSFPTDKGLPEGAAQLSFDADANSFAYANQAAIGSFNGIDPTKICYPSSLYYTVKTTLKATDNDNVVWPENLTVWEGATYWDAWGDVVRPTTRTIALRNEINYGVARLKTNVKTVANATTLEDNAVQQGGAAANNKIPVSRTVNQGTVHSFQVTGVLVGGQPTVVGWDFYPTDGATRTYTVYDSKMNGTIYATASNTAYNSTMVLDNKVASGDQENINIAIELLNNSGTDFYGYDGLVPAGGKFYMVANLKVDTDSAEPKRVFAQDYVTTANLTINSLRNAYVTIPDLRSTKLQLGLAVDLAWQNGLTFDVTIQ
ncbi:MAG: hypothetical protein IJP08_05040 [Bacteroidaceae bacterium]|nr:hypothetical protein [Bacteroidaceae bacterium]